ncbi:hypothetical protein Tsubulata_011758 [Turnera subulata]|uniref:Uncharacterized protein n=1 Tax=Turnera subulata TaxID=218843 RepID=A0A9Q0GDM2_9ROSI|nr:hypothetical protein Tsubulata_011758 [Turnera subulata]
MKYLEGKKSTPKWGSNLLSEGGALRQYMPLNLAVREAYFKGSLVDRVASLERRLFQLCFEIESSSTSGTSSQTSGYASSSQGSKQEQPFSLPTFNPNPRQKVETLVLAETNRLEVQAKSCEEEQMKQLSSTVQKEKPGKKKPNNKEEKASKNGKKKVSSKWPHLRLLGC